jgi:ribosomal protein S18 acetylase RimI-like enzyme
MEFPSLEDMTAAGLSGAISDNLVAHVSWVHQQSDGMIVREDEQLVLVDSGLPCDTFNVVCRARLGRDALAGRIAAVVEHFRKVGRPFSWWVGPADRPADLEDHLLAAGLEAAESENAMAADLQSLAPPSKLAHDLRIERVRTAEQVRQFAALSAANWDPPDRDVLHFYETAGPVLLGAACPMWLYLGYLGDRPVATAELTEGGGVAGLYNISTLAAYRRRGIGSAMVLQPLLDAREAGYRTAVLQASPQGAAVYARIGFVATGQFREYKPSISP